MSEDFTTFLDGLISYDYILFGSVFSIFLLLTIIGIMLRRRVTLSISILLLSFTVLIIGSTFGYMKMHQYLYNNTILLTSQKHLTYTEAVVVYGVIKNSSKFDFKNCKITASVHKITGNSIKDYLFELNPFKKMSILEQDILKGQEREFKIIIEPFIYTKDYNISLGANCI